MVHIKHMNILHSQAPPKMMKFQGLRSLPGPVTLLIVQLPFLTSTASIISVHRFRTRSGSRFQALALLSYHSTLAFLLLSCILISLSGLRFHVRLRFTFMFISATSFYIYLFLHFHRRFISIFIPVRILVGRVYRLWKMEDGR